MSVAVMVLIFLHSSMPADLSSEESGVIVRLFTGLTGFDEEIVTVIVRKTAHFLEYLMLGICLTQTMRYRRYSRNDFASLNGRCIFLPACAAGILYAFSDEVHQLFVPGRSCELRDVCIDAAGVICGSLIIRIKMKRLSSKK